MNKTNHLNRPTGKVLMELVELTDEAIKDKLIFKHKFIRGFYLTPLDIRERIKNGQAYFSPEVWQLVSPQEYLDIKLQEFAAAKNKYEKAVAYINNYLFNN